MKLWKTCFAAFVSAALASSASGQDPTAEQPATALAEPIGAQLLSALQIRWENLIRTRSDAESGRSCDARVRGSYGSDFRRRFASRHRRLVAEVSRQSVADVSDQDIFIVLTCYRGPTLRFRNEQLSAYIAELHWFEDHLGIRPFTSRELVLRARQEQMRR